MHASHWRRALRLKWWTTLRRYYALRGRRPVGGANGSMLPKFGKGQFVSVFQRGPFLDLHDERTGDMIRLVPYQPNHGVMVEFWQDGALRWRSHFDLEQFKDIGFGAGERFS